MHGQAGQECFDLQFAGEAILARPHAVETDKPYDDLKEMVGGRSGNRPIDIGSLCVNGVVEQAEHLSDFIEKFRLIFHRVRHTLPRCGTLRLLITGIGKNCLKTPPISHYQGKMES